MPSVAVVPAAGRGERFGGAKLAAMLRGEALLNHTIRCLLDGGVDAVVIVTSPNTQLDHVSLAADPRVRQVTNPDPSRGMFSSLQEGLAAAPGDPILILPGDMPFVAAETVTAVLAEARDSQLIVSPSHLGQRGHPIALPARLRQAILSAQADTTLAEVLEPESGSRRIIELNDPGILRDVDVPEDLFR